MSNMTVIYALFLMLIYLAILGVCVAQYIITALSVYTIADKRGISNAWLAWLPIGDAWVMGKIAEEYDERTNVKKNWAKTLLALSLTGGVLLVMMYVMFMVFMFSAIVFNASLEAVLVPLIIVYVLLLVAALLVCAANILKVICTYKLYESIVPQKAIKYMVVSIIVPLGNAVCLMKAKNELLKQLELQQLEYFERMRENAVQQTANGAAYNQPVQQTGKVTQNSLAQKNGNDTPEFNQ